MRHGMLHAIVWLTVGTGALQAQERIPLPPPDPLPPGARANSPAQSPQSPPAFLQQGPYSGLAPYVPYQSPTQSGGQTPNPNGGPNQGPYQGPQGPYQGQGPNGPYGPPPGPYGPYGPPPGPYGPYGAPPGPYGPPPPPFLRGDPVGNPAFWANFEALIWWSKAAPLPTPVVTTGPATQGANAGGLGVPGTSSLNGPLHFGTQGGMRLFLGGWLEPTHTWGIEGGFAFLGQSNSGFTVADRSNSGNFIINEPVAGAPFSTQVSFPGVQTGGVNVNATTEFWSFDFNGLFNLLRSGSWSVNLLGGFKYMHLEESLDINSNSAFFTTTIYTDNFGNVLANAPPGSTVNVFDHFGAQNNFYGGQVGARIQYAANRFSFNATGTLAVGSTVETVNVNGTTTVFPINGAPVPLQGGNYATLQSGSYTTNHFALAPGMQLNLGYQFTPFMRGIIGYNFVYLSNVARPGNQIDNTYDGMNHPNVPMISSSFWTQGVNVGLQFSY